MASPIPFQPLVLRIRQSLGDFALGAIVKSIGVVMLDKTGYTILNLRHTKLDPVYIECQPHSMALAHACGVSLQTLCDDTTGWGDELRDSLKHYIGDLTLDTVARMHALVRSVTTPLDGLFASAVSIDVCRGSHLCELLGNTNGYVLLTAHHFGPDYPSVRELIANSLQIYAYATGQPAMWFHWSSVPGMLRTLLRSVVTTTSPATTDSVRVQSFAIALPPPPRVPCAPDADANTVAIYNALFRWRSPAAWALLKPCLTFGIGASSSLVGVAHGTDIAYRCELGGGSLRLVPNMVLPLSMNIFKVLSDIISHLRAAGVSAVGVADNYSGEEGWITSAKVSTIRPGSCVFAVNCTFALMSEFRSFRISTTRVTWNRGLHHVPCAWVAGGAVSAQTFLNKVARIDVQLDPTLLRTMSPYIVHMPVPVGVKALFSALATQISANQIQPAAFQSAVRTASQCITGGMDVSPSQVVAVFTEYFARCQIPTTYTTEAAADAVCNISLSPLLPSDTVVSTACCLQFYSAGALTTWLGIGNGRCPICPGPPRGLKLRAPENGPSLALQFADFIRDMPALDGHQNVVVYIRTGQHQFAAELAMYVRGMGGVGIVIVCNGPAPMADPLAVCDAVIILGQETARETVLLRRRVMANKGASVPVPVYRVLVPGTKHHRAHQQQSIEISRIEYVTDIIM